VPCTMYNMLLCLYYYNTCERTASATRKNIKYNNSRCTRVRGRAGLLRQWNADDFSRSGQTPSLQHRRRSRAPPETMTVGERIAQHQSRNTERTPRTRTPVTACVPCATTTERGESSWWRLLRRRAATTTTAAATSHYHYHCRRRRYVV
jgi:hypothetical protein